MKIETVYRWVKASETMPNLGGVGNGYPIRFFINNGWRLTKGFKNFDQSNPEFYFEHFDKSYLTNENVEWLEPTEAVVMEPDVLDNIIWRAMNWACKEDVTAAFHSFKKMAERHWDDISYLATNGIKEKISEDGTTK